MSGVPKLRLSKRWLMSMISKYGVDQILFGFEGTDEEALELLRNDPREVFTHKDVIGDPSKQATRS